MCLRLTYWVHRICKDGGKILAPDQKASLIQWIDSRDLANFIIIVVKRSLYGTFNAACPSSSVTFSTMLQNIKAICGKKAVEFEWVSKKILEKNQIDDQRLPFMFRSIEDWENVNASKAHSLGLNCRSFERTVNDVLKSKLIAKKNYFLSLEEEMLLIGAL